MSKFNVSLSDHFTYKKIFKQVLMPVLMMVWISLYGVVDGLFISNIDGSDGFTGVNLVFPLIMIVGGVGYMFASGGTALVSKLLGENKRDEANKVFTMVMLFSFALGLVLSIAGFRFVEPIARAMGSVTEDCTEAAIQKAILYGKILILGQSLYMTQTVFQNFFVVNEKPYLAFVFTLAAGITNIVFDAIFVNLWGVAGAAIATILGFAVGTVGPYIYFKKHKNGVITFAITKVRFKPIIHSMFNGLSDFIFNVSTSVVSILFNIELLKYFGHTGVEAYATTMYLQFIFVSIFVGYVCGIAPIIGYNYGAQNHAELKNVVKKSIILVSISSILMLGVSHLFAVPLTNWFVGRDAATAALSCRSLRIFAISFLMCGFSIFITSMFTALNNGLVSGIISIFRTLIFQVLCIIIAPLIFGSEGVLWAATLAEGLAIVVAGICFIAFKKKYKY